MKYLPFFLFILLCSLAPMVIYAQSDTSYFNSENLEVPGWDYADYYRVSTKRADGKYDIKEYYSNNKLMTTGVYSDSGRRDGNFISYSKRGIKKTEGVYRHDVRVGEHKEYYESGVLHAVAHFDEEGNNTGELVVYYEDSSIRRKELFKKGKSVAATCYDEQGKEVKYFPYEERPEFPGGEKELVKYLSANMHYPELSREAGLEGVVSCKFVVNASGAISSIKILKSPGAEFESEVVRLIVGMPKWKPGMHDGEAVKFYFTLPVTFRLD